MYIHRNSKYYAIQFDGDNREKIVDFLGIKKDFCELWRNEDTRDCHLLVVAPLLNLGRVDLKEWILMKADKSNYLVIEEANFRKEYEEV